jgi:HD-GYP domain-containing protein (c-di-GMP phosphodiesterase class II)
MLTIVDIYDALTASDRPYKRRLPVDTAIRILRQEAAKNKINSDLVELFEQRQVFTVLGHTLTADAHSVA